MNKLYVKSLLYTEPDCRDEKGQYPFNLPLLTSLSNMVFENPVTFIIGENGAGKSTIIECIAQLCGLNLEGGSKNNNFKTYESKSDLAERCKLIKYPYYPKDSYFYRAESYYNLITDLDELGVSEELFHEGLHNYSRGEGFLNLLDYRFFGNGFYLFDEPESGLSFQSLLHVLVRIKELVLKNSQFIISTHSPVILSYPNALVYEINDDKVQRLRFEDSDLYRKWEILFARREKFIEQVLM